MRKLGQVITAATVALGLLACTEQPSTSTPAAAPSVVLDDKLVDQIKRGESMDQVRALIGAKPIVNYQAGHEIWIYQGVSEPAGTTPRTVTVQFDERGTVRNVGKMDLPK